MTNRKTLGLGMPLAALLVFICSGCSWAFVTPPLTSGKASAWASRDCTRSKLAPVLDVAMTGFQVIRTGFALQAADSFYEDPAQPLSREADVGFGVGLTALFLASAIYGLRTTAACAQSLEFSASSRIKGLVSVPGGNAAAAGSHDRAGQEEDKALDWTCRRSSWWGSGGLGAAVDGTGGQRECGGLRARA